MALPDWVKKFRSEGVEIVEKNGKFYARKVTSVYDAKLGRSRKKTGEYLGKVTPEGILPPKHKRTPRLGGRLEAGNIAFLDPFFRPLQGAVAKHFPDDWQSILAAAAIKLCYREPCSQFRIRYETSLAKRRWPDAHLSDDSLPELLRRIGLQWNAQRDVFAELAADEKHMAIDLSHVFSESQNIPWLEYGHNDDDVWRPQLQVLLMWGTTTHRPGFLQLLPGATNSAQTILHSLKEMPLRDVIAVVDKGFWSPDNIEAFEEAEVHYAMALRRDLPMVNLKTHAMYRKNFLYKDATQWWRKDEWDGRTIYHYFDKTLVHNEESTYMRRAEQAKDPDSKKKIIESYRKNRNRLGTLSILTDTGLDAEEVYRLYKERREVEYAYDNLQNDLEAEVTWMRSKESIVGFHFIMFLALHLYSQALDHLKRKQMLSTWSVRDVLTYLSKVEVVEVDGKDHLIPVTKQTQTILDRLETAITQNIGL